LHQSVRGYPPAASATQAGAATLAGGYDRHAVYRHRQVSDDSFKSVVDAISKVIDGAGVAVVVIGLLVATVVFAASQRDRAERAPAYRVYRQQVGKAILLGLEFLVAADIIRTVAVAPTFRGVGVLAVVVAVRTFLSFTLDVELEGHWPWQSRRGAPRSAD
jgi:uncharacterized membrane protein